MDLKEANKLYTKEYQAEGKKPQLTVIDGFTYVIPFHYTKKDKEAAKFAFLNDLFDTHATEDEKYKKRGLFPEEIALHDEEILVTKPFKYHDKEGISTSEIRKEIYNNAKKKYITAVQKTQRYNKIHTDGMIYTEVDSQNISFLNKDYDQYLAKKVVDNSKKAAFKLGTFLSKNATKLTNNINITPKQIKTATIVLLSGATITAGCVALNNVPQKAEKAKTEQAPEAKKEVKKPEKKLTPEEIAKREALIAQKKQEAIFKYNVNLAKQNQEEIFAFIAFTEGYKPLYKCEAKKTTGGYGTRFNEDGTQITEPVSKEKGYKLAVHHLNEKVYPFLNNITRKLSLDELAAVSSFIYNTGGARFEGSFLCKTINKTSSKDAIKKAFSLYRSIKGEYSQGLVNAQGIRCLAIEKGVTYVLGLNRYAYGNNVQYFVCKEGSAKPIQNSNKTFTPRPAEDVDKDLAIYENARLDSTVLHILPPAVKNSLMKKHNLGKNTYIVSAQDIKTQKPRS